MPDLPRNERPSASSQEFDEQVGTKEARKMLARHRGDRTIWFGLGMFGLIGWSVAIPTLLGVGIGVWLDLNVPGSFSWTLALLLAGAALGCMNAWYWVSQEQQAMDREREHDNDD